jgi:SNF2 family DNA or RNA helicase
VSRAYLLDHQRAGLFDEMGVGKTAPAIVAAAELAADTNKPALITVPAYLIPNWFREIERFAPGVKAVAADGDGAQARHEAFQSNADLILTSYHNWATFDGNGQTQKRVARYDELLRRPWSAYVHDEAHRLRGYNSLWTKQLWKAWNADSKNRNARFWPLTGTPLIRDPGDFFSLGRVFDRQVFTGYWKFVETFCEVEVTPWAQSVGQLKPGMEEAFWRLVSQYGLRRMQKDIPELAGIETFYREIVVTLPPSVIQSARRAKKEYILEHPDLERAEFLDGGGALYNRLRQLATLPPTAVKPKLDALVELLDDLAGQRVVVYCWYRDAVAAVEEVVRKRFQGRNVAKADRRDTFVITGDTSSARRDPLIQQWSSSPAGVLIATIGALKEGANLQAGNQLVFLEEAELPADMDQVVKRLARRGQTKPVMVHTIRAQGSVDFAIAKILRIRSEGIERAMAGYQVRDAVRQARLEYLQEDL